MTFMIIIIMFDHGGAFDTVDHNLNPLFESQPSPNFFNAASLYSHFLSIFPLGTPY